MVTGQRPRDAAQHVACWEICCIACLYLLSGNIIPYDFLRHGPLVKLRSKHRLRLCNIFVHFKLSKTVLIWNEHDMKWAVNK